MRFTSSRPWRTRSFPLLTFALVTLAAGCGTSEPQDSSAADVVTEIDAIADSLSGDTAGGDSDVDGAPADGATSQDLLAPTDLDSFADVAIEDVMASDVVAPSEVDSGLDTAAEDTGAIDIVEGDGASNDTFGTDTSGTDTSGDDAGTPFVLDCASYCAKVAEACPGENAPYDFPAQCLEACGAMPLGAVPDVAKNTIACRFGRALLAEDQPAAAASRCVEAGPSGGGVCGSRCDAFCTLTSALCPGTYGSSEACGTACPSFPSASVVEAEPAGDTYGCRLEATLDGVCASATPDGGLLCASPPLAGESCGAAFEVPSLPFDTTGDTTDANDDLSYTGGPCGGDFGGAGGSGAPDQVWRYVATEAADVTVTLTGKSGYDPILYVLSGCDDPTSSCLDKRDSVGFNAKETITLPLAKDQTIFIVVDAASAGGTYFGPYTLTVSNP